MATRIRLKRMGRRNRPFYRVVVIDSRKQRDGVAIEEVGWCMEAPEKAAWGLLIGFKKELNLHLQSGD